MYVIELLGNTLGSRHAVSRLELCKGGGGALRVLSDKYEKFSIYSWSC